MTISQLGIAYLAVGVVLAIALVAIGRLPRREAPLVVVLWPIWLPLALAEARPVERDLRERVRYLRARIGELDRMRREHVFELEGLQRVLGDATVAEYPPAELR